MTIVNSTGANINSGDGPRSFRRRSESREETPGKGSDMGVAHLVSQIAKRTALMGLNFGAGLPSAGESPRGGDHGDAAPVGRSTGKLTTVEAAAPKRDQLMAHDAPRRLR
jgi:hypothetical protein